MVQWKKFPFKKKKKPSKVALFYIRAVDTQMDYCFTWTQIHSSALLLPFINIPICRPPAAATHTGTHSGMEELIVWPEVYEERLITKQTHEGFLQCHSPQASKAGNWSWFCKVIKFERKSKPYLSKESFGLTKDSI